MNKRAPVKIAVRQVKTDASIKLSGIVITTCLVIVALLSTHTLFLLLFGMLPGFIAAIVDRDSNKYLTKIVVSFNISGIAPYLVHIMFDAKKANEIAINFILEPTTWLYIYIYSAIGWVVFWCFPNASILIKNALTQFKMYELNTELIKLTNEWGEKVKKPDDDSKSL